MSEQEQLRVFISYSHDSDQHKKQVAAFAKRLIADGFDCRYDQQIVGSPGGGWPTWAEREIRKADIVLMACTARYKRIYYGEVELDRGQGVAQETHIIRNNFYFENSVSVKYVPVLPPGGTARNVPDILKGHTQYDLKDHYQKLVAFLNHHQRALATCQPTKEAGDMAAAAPVRGAALETGASPTSASFQILWIDDEPSIIRPIRETVRANLARVGIHTEIDPIDPGEGSTVAIGRAENNQPYQVVICDLRVNAKFDGIVEIKTIRATLPNIPVVIFSAYVGDYRDQLERLKPRPYVVAKEGTHPSDSAVERLVDTLATLLRTKEPCILHISDLFLGCQTVDMAAEDMLVDLKEVCSGHHVESPDLVVVSGNIGHTAEVTDYRGGATVFLTRLLNALDLSEERLVLVPGEHDLRGATPGLEWFGYCALLRELHEGGAGGLSRFSAASVISQQHDVKQQDLLSLNRFEQLGTIVVGFNSVSFHRGPGDPELSLSGSVGEDQIEQVSAWLEQQDTRGYMRIAVLHHPLHGVYAPAGSLLNEQLVEDAGRVLYQLAMELGFHLVLHGHGWPSSVQAVDYCEPPGGVPPAGPLSSRRVYVTSSGSLVAPHARDRSPRAFLEYQMITTASRLEEPSRERHWEFKVNTRRRRAGSRRWEHKPPGGAESWHALLSDHVS